MQVNWVIVGGLMCSCIRALVNSGLEVATALLLQDSYACIDMCMGMRVDMCMGMRVDMCIYTSTHMRIDMCVDMCIYMCADMCAGM